MGGWSALSVVVATVEQELVALNIMNGPKTRGVHHVGLTVTKLEESAAFFTALLGWKEVKRNDAYPAIFVSDGQVMVTLWKVREEPAVPFDRKRNVGLHHVAFAMQSETELRELHARLVQAGVEMQFAPEPIGAGPAQHFICFDPSGIRVEFTWPGS